MNQEETWKDIPGYEGFYQASDLGQIRSLPFISTHGQSGKGKIRKLSTKAKGYKCLRLSVYGITVMHNVHRLIALTFLGPSDLEVDHIDGNPSNNALSNLRYVTRRENITFAKLKTKCTSVYTGVHWVKRERVWNAYIRINGKKKYLGRFKNEYQAHLAYQSTLEKLKTA